MGSMNCDLEGAFTNDDPEAVLDFLALRSQHLQHHDQDGTPANAIPIFSSENDMAAFVRDLTIDDTISHCFADIPSACDDVIPRSASTLVKSRPERKLVECNLKAWPAIREQGSSSDIKSRTGIVKGYPSSLQLPHSVSSDLKNKPRGFLASLLARGHKHRKTGQGQQFFHQGTASTVDASPPPASFSCNGSSTTASMSCKAVTSKHTQDHSSRCPSTSKELFGESSDCQHCSPETCEVNDTDLGQTAKKSEFQSLPEVENETVVKTESISTVTPRCSVSHAVGSNYLDNKPQALLFKTDSSLQTKHSIKSKSEHGDNFVKSHPESGCVFHGPTESELISQLKERGNISDPFSLCGHCVPGVFTQHGKSSHIGITRRGHPQCNTCQRTFCAESLSSMHHAAPALHIRHTQAKTVKYQVNGSRQREETAGESPRSPNDCHTCGEGCKTWQRRRDGQDQGLLSQAAINQWSDGIDSFIDFERDPNMELPLDSHLSAQFAFEQGVNLNSLKVTAGSCEFPAHKIPFSETCAASSLIPSQLPRAFLSASGVEESHGTTPNGMAPLFPQSALGSFSHSSLPVSTSTQTQEQQSQPADTVWTQNARHCLHAAITQLSTMAPCSACQITISKVVINLERVLEEMTSDSDTAHDINNTTLDGAQTVDSIPERNDCATLVDSAAYCSNHQTEDACGKEKAEEERQGNGPQGALFDVQEDRVDVRNETQMTESVQDSPDTACLDLVTTTSSPCLASEHAAKPSQGSMSEGRTLLSTATACADSDSDSTSTIISQPSTVLTCQARNCPSSNGQNHVTQPSNHVIDSPQTRPAVGENGAGGKNSPYKSNSTSPHVHVSSHKDSAHNSPCLVNKLSNNTHTEGRRECHYRTAPSHGGAERPYRYAGERDGDSESFITSSWSEITSISSVSDVMTSADESSYYSGEDDNEEEEEEEDDAVMAVVRLGLLDEDRDDCHLRQHRLQRHLAAILRQTTISTAAVETVVAATGERLNGYDREQQVCHVNQGTLYPFSAPDQSSATASLVTRTSARNFQRHSARSHENASLSTLHTDDRSSSRTKKGAASLRLFSPDRQASLVSARQMTSEEFRESYDRSSDISKLKRSQLDGDVPWDLIQCSDTDEDAGSEKAWYNVTSEEELERAHDSDSDTSTTVSDW